MKKRILFFYLIVSLFLVTGCKSYSLPISNESNTQILENLEAYSESAYMVLNNNQPNFSESELTTTSYESYSELDHLNRAGVAIANIGIDLMPTEERGNISSIKPSGWQTVKYDFVDGKYLYNRCHLIGFQLTGENANKKNLITCTRYMNVEGMLPFENMIADYIKETKNHVLYRVTPIYDGDNLVAKGAILEAKSIEDQGEGICFNVFVYNVQPGVEINYQTGESKAIESNEEEKKENNSEVEIRGNSKSKIYHVQGQADYEEMKDSPNLVIFHNEEEAINAGYKKAKR